MVAHILFPETGRKATGAICHLGPMSEYWFMSFSAQYHQRKKSVFAMLLLYDLFWCTAPHRQHCTPQSFEELGTLSMHNHCVIKKLWLFFGHGFGHWSRWLPVTAVLKKVDFFG